MRDCTGWYQVNGSRFHAFFPLGSKILLDQDILFLAEAYGWSEDVVMRMSSSRRHRMVKTKEELSRQTRSGGETITPTASPTGVDPFPRTGAGGSSQEVSVGYSSPR